MDELELKTSFLSPNLLSLTSKHKQAEHLEYKTIGTRDTAKPSRAQNTKATSSPCEVDCTFYNAAISSFPGSLLITNHRGPTNLFEQLKQHEPQSAWL